MILNAEAAFYIKFYLPSHKTKDAYELCEKSLEKLQ